MPIQRLRLTEEDCYEFIVSAKGGFIDEQRTNNRDLLDKFGFADIFLMLIPAFVRRVGNSG